MAAKHKAQRNKRKKEKWQKKHYGQTRTEVAKEKADHRLKVRQSKFAK